MKRHIIILTAIIAAVSAVSCNKSDILTPAAQAFAQQQNLGLYGDNITYLQYRKYTHQYSRNVSGTKFRMQTSDLNTYFACTFSEKPAKGRSIEVSIKTNGIAGNPELSDTYSVIKEQDGKFWLWNEERATGLVIMLAQ